MSFCVKMSVASLLLCRINIAALLAVLLLGGCGSSPRYFAVNNSDSAQRTAAIQQIAGRLPPHEYKLGPGDVVEIKVFGIEDLDLTLRVPESGTLDLPLAGRIGAGGKTTDEVREEIASVLAQRYMKNPHVSVFIKEFASYRVSVVGAVTKPGTVILRKGGATIVDVLAEAGGLLDNAGNEVYVTTNSNGAPLTRTVNLALLLEKGKLDENVSVSPGDSVYVPEGGYVFVTGHVRQPGSYELRKNMTVLQAIGTAGDFTSTASHTVRLIRRTTANVEVQHVDVASVASGKSRDIALQPSDVLEAKGSAWKVPVYGTLDFIKGIFGVTTSVR